MAESGHKRSRLAADWFSGLGPQHALEAKKHISRIRAQDERSEILELDLTPRMTMSLSFIGLGTVSQYQEL